MPLPVVIVTRFTGVLSQNASKLLVLYFTC